MDDGTSWWKHLWQGFAFGLFAVTLLALFSGSRMGSRFLYPVLWGFLVPAIGFWLVMGAHYHSVARSDPWPEPLEARLRSALGGAGLSMTGLVYQATGRNARYPRVAILGLSAVVPRRVVEECSDEALIWSVKTTLEAAQGLFRVGLPMVLMGLLPTIFILHPRIGSPLVAVLTAIVIVVWIFAAVYLLINSFQVAADRRFTVTEADRRAAKEALSYPYFAQRDKRPFDKWMFFSGELRGRARRLGIELERGYRADA